MRILHLYRPRVPTVRAQAVQVVHTCEALARRGHQVTVFADRVGEGPEAAMGPEAALAWYGLSAHPNLDLQIAPTAWAPGAGLWFRGQVWAWCRSPGVVYARAKRYIRLIPESLPVVIEAHEVDSEIDREAGRDPSTNLRLETDVLARARGVVTNCQGTLTRLGLAHPSLPPRRVIHNGTRGDRVVARHPSPTPLVGYTGSPKLYKGLSTALASVARWPAGVELELVGGAPDTPLPPRVRAVPPVPYPALPEHLSRYHALLLPLDDNLFGRWLTSPLKLWDYLATGIPIVAADLPTTREIGGDRLFYYPPGDEAGLAEAVSRALAAGVSRPFLRSWDDRAAEIEDFLRELQLM